MLNGISAMSPWSSYGVYGASYASRAAQTQGPDRAQSVQRPSAVWTARRAAQPGAPVQPVTPVKAVNGDERKPGQFSLNIREGADPVEMAVRMRIKYMGDDPARQGAAQAAGADKAQAPELAGLKKAGAQGADPVKEAKSALEEGECQTCKERKYQDGSDDPGVSFKAPTNIAPEQVASAVRGHENEHVVREQAKARQDDRKVVSQSVTYHTAICPECGKAYVSGGTTRTVTKADNNQQAEQQPQRQDPRVPFSAVA